MKKGWEIKKLGEICKFQNGFAFQSKDYKENGLPIIRITNIQDDEIDTKKLVYFNSEDYSTDLDRFKVFKGDILIAMSGATTGKIGINNSNQTFYLNQRVGKFIPKTGLEKGFLYYFLKSNVEESLKMAIGAAQPNLSTEQINNFGIPIPPLPEQQKIVALLDKCFQTIDRAKTIAEKNLQNAKELFESYLLEVFKKKGDGWIISTIGETCKLTTGGTPSTSKKEYYKGGDIKWLVSGDINQKEIFNCEGRITELGLENSNARYLPVNSVLIALNGQGKTRGTVAMLRTEATCNQSLVSIYPNDVNKVLPELIHANLEGRYDEIRKLTGDSGNDRRGLNMPIIRNISFSYPKSLTEQQTIVRQLDTLKAKTQKLEEVYKKKLNDLEELKKSILQKAFTGELNTEIIL